MSKIGPSTTGMPPPGKKGVRVDVRSFKRPRENETKFKEEEEEEDFEDFRIFIQIKKEM